jgi:hypothetical protein
MDRDLKSSAQDRARVQRPEGPPPKGGHSHRCRRDHRWVHTGPSSTDCALPRDDAGRGRAGAVHETACPVCSGSEDIPSLHEHRCESCGGVWSHRGHCAEGPLASCPWCVPNSKTSELTAVRGSHRHTCPRCAGRWRHGGRCREPAVTETIPCVLCARSRARRLSRGLVAVAAASVILVIIMWSVGAPSRRTTPAPERLASAVPGSDTPRDWLATSPRPSRLGQDPGSNHTDAIKGVPSVTAPPAIAREPSPPRESDRGPLEATRVPSPPQSVTTQPTSESGGPSAYPPVPPPPRPGVGVASSSPPVGKPPEPPQPSVAAAESKPVQPADVPRPPVAPPGVSTTVRGVTGTATVPAPPVKPVPIVSGPVNAIPGTVRPVPVEKPIAAPAGTPSGASGKLSAPASATGSLSAKETEAATQVAAPPARVPYAPNVSVPDPTKATDQGRPLGKAPSAASNASGTIFP